MTKRWRIADFVLSEAEVTDDDSLSVDFDVDEDGNDLYEHWDKAQNSEQDFDEVEIRKKTLLRKKFGFLDESFGSELDCTITLDRTVKSKKRRL